MSNWTVAEREAIESMRARGYAVVVFTDEEMLGSALHRADVEDAGLSSMSRAIECARLDNDLHRTDKELQEIYDPGNAHEGEHPVHDVGDWHRSGSRKSYWDWVWCRLQGEEE